MLLKMNLFSMSTLTKAAHLREIKTSQDLEAARVTTYLKDTWCSKVKSCIRNAFLKVGKGWFHLDESNRDTYDFSKMRKFLTLCRVMMQDEMRSLSTQSFETFTHFLEAVTSPEITVQTTADVTNDYPTGVARDKRVCVVTIDLEIVPVTKAIGSVAARLGIRPATPLDDVVPTFLGIFDRGIACTQGILTLDQQLMTEIFWSQENYFSSVHPKEAFMVGLRERVEAALTKAMQPAAAYLELFDAYHATLNLDVEEEVDAVAKDEDFSLKMLLAEVAQATKALAEANKNVPASMAVGAIKFNTKQVREAVLEKRTGMLKALKDLVAATPRKMMQEATKTFESFQRQLKVTNESVEDVDAVRKFIADLPGKVAQLKVDMAATDEWYQTLEDMRYRLRDDDSKLRYNALYWPQKLVGLVEETERSLRSDEEKYLDEMKEEQATFNNTIASLEAQVNILAEKTDVKKLEDMHVEVTSILANLKQAETDSQLFNSRETLFGLEQADYSAIRRTLDTFEPYYQLWNTAAVLQKSHQGWMQDSWLELDPAVVEQTVNSSFKTFFKTGRTFTGKGLPALAELCEEQKVFVDDLKKFVPLVQALRMPGMKERHWESLSKELGFELRPGPHFNLTTAEEMGLLDHLELLTRVSDVAAKEFGIEQAMNKMRGEWEDIEMVVMEYGDSGTYIIKVDEAIMQQLDDHIVMTQSMSFSPFKAPFEAEIADWEKQLNLVSETIDAWIMLQRQWMYLQPIFSSEDIQEQLPLEAKKFMQVDRLWRRALGDAKARPHMLTVCTNKAQIEHFVEANKQLDTVQKGLADYLETKRLAFARFFFLSDGDILQILSQTRNPLTVQDHLGKCFEAITLLEFEDDLQIVAMESKEGESVRFKEPMYPEGNVESWLGKVEQCMFQSVRETSFLAIQDYEATPRKEWVLKWPGMTVLCVGGIFWSKEVEAAIEAHDMAGYVTKSTDDLLDLTDLVRGKLTKLQRLTLGALITIDVHARDVVENLQHANLQTIGDFEWVSQLRYYWKKDDVYVDMVQASRPYGYEYLGNTPRLVITPLTDRCYMTLMSAMHQNLGGAPAGPAGTGKTETTKDLAKALAKACLVFNCSDGLDHKQLAKFFKGLASSGAWACFDEFNRIDLEVLSVVATQIDTIQRAIQRQDKRFVFEETELNMNPNCAVFITMNPGYAGRSELPDNLKALFRPCAMMVPDYALIAEISLYSYGYRNAKMLSKKMVATFRLSSEQLSSQKHYDYGMRAVKSTITAVGNLKGQAPDDPEDQLVLRGLRDVNVPKFLAHDLPLFEGIISDLFPGVKKPDADYDALLNAMQRACRSTNLQPTEGFVQKVIQLYETTLVRHGLMLVGPTMGGKTACYQTLAKTMTTLHKEKQSGFEKVEVMGLNPKSILAGQMYGEFDKNTQEWTDGVLAHYMREFAESSTPDKKWIMFDGPVDAVWIEDMNTVLDDNKKLCLVSGATIPLTDTMTMMFEVDNLEEASPATVSRCGMIYMESKALGVAPLLTSWLERIPEPLAKFRPLLSGIFTALVPPLINWLRREAKEMGPTEDHNLVASMFGLVDALLAKHALPVDADDEEKIALLGRLVPAFAIFATVWSVGAALVGTYRPAFDAKLRALLAEAMASSSSDLVAGLGQCPPLPTEGDVTVFDVCMQEETGEWALWMTTIPEYKCNPETPFTDIIVPTPDSVSNSFVIDRLMAIHRNVLCVGETGTGKTVTASQKLNSLDGTWEAQFLTFSARTSANQTQDLLDSKVDKLRKVGNTVFCGPPGGKRYAILVDDMNMPMREKYGAQPPIELLRQWMDHGGWYERRAPFTFRKITNIQFVGSMGPPGGGRNPVTPRYLRHFNYLSFVEMSDKSVSTIFNAIVSSFLSAKFNEDVQSTGTAIVGATVDLYNQIREALLPTPNKSHYTFNLRDMGRVVQGFMRGDAKLIQTAGAAQTLWLHECMRVFRDRLVNSSDAAWFDTTTAKLFTEHFGAEQKDVVDTERVIYGDYMVPGAEIRTYAQVKDMTALLKVVEDYLEDYNSMASKPMKLVMFLDAIEHVSRVCRVIRLPLGNALLLGVGGSGRQSLTRLAAAMEEFELFQVEIVKGYGQNDWKDDLKTVLKMAGKDGKDTVFMLTDTQIVQESFLEDVNNILNAGEVPNLMGMEDMEEITEALSKLMTAEGITPTPLGVLAYFTKRVRQNLHCVICFSPIGDAFRRRLRMFPSLVNCCTIDWFHEWPEEALRSVARNFLAETQLHPDQEQHDALLTGAVGSFVAIHQSVERASTAFYEELRRYNYVTPTSYLELLTTFMNLLGAKRSEIMEGKRRLEIGLEKLGGAEVIVKDLQQQIIEKQPVLEQTSKEVDELLVVIDHDKKEADETRVVVEKQEAEAKEQAAAAEAIKSTAEGELAEALPALEEAVKSLNELDVKDMQEVRAFMRPPKGVLLTMEAVCVMFEDKPEMIMNNDTMKKEKSYWGPAKARLQDAKKFKQSLLDFDKDNIPQKTIENIEPYINNPDFVPEEIAKSSKACTALCKWVRSMHKYHGVSVRVEPLRIQLAEAEASYAKTMGELAIAQETLAKVQAKIDQLEFQFKEGNDKKEALLAELDLCNVRLDRADKLIGGLGGEKVRWIETVAQLGKDLVNVCGDIIVSAGSIAYMGPFTPTFRARMLAEWHTSLSELRVPHTPGATVVDVLENPVQTRSWVLAGLPSDSVSVENALIISKARRWPLMIDPQGQANKWIRNMEADKLDVVKLTDKDFLRPLENGVRFGRAVLLESVGETLDPAIEPVLLKQTFKQGGQEVMKIGDNIIPYSPDFRLYMTTKLRNPHYAPEVSVKVSLLNFFVTLEGLEDQLLNTVVGEERPDLSELKSQLMISNAKMKKELKEIEDKILELLSASSGDILDDEVLINTLSQSKITSDEISLKVAEAETTEKEIDETRELYRPVAIRASLLFFCISDLALIDPMYQYSLSWFISLFVRGVKEAEPADDVTVRGHHLNEYFTYSLYVNVCRSLFETHKLTFSMMMLVKIQQAAGLVDALEWRFLLAGPTTTTLDMEKPENTPWMTDQMWVECWNLSQLPTFTGFHKDVAANLAVFKELFDSNQAHEMPLCEPWQSKLTPFQRLLVLRCFRPDKCISGVQTYIAAALGTRFIEPPPFDLAACYKEASSVIPLIFVLSPGADPMSDLWKLAEELKMGRKFEIVSLGKGQGAKAEAVLADAMDTGKWVALQNCHLASSWMSELDRIVENMNPDYVNPHFRLWLTALPTPTFPVSILQNGVKMTLEPPKGLKSNLTRSYTRLDDATLAESAKPAAWRRLLFGMCLFHAVIQDRRKYGPLGWNIRYDFTEGDLQISMTQMHQYLEDYAEVPYRVLRFLTSEINYGGRVTDDKDRRLINMLLETFINEGVIEEGYKFSPSGVFAINDAVELKDYLAYISQLPIAPAPEIFGLHENADITCDQNETYAMFATILSLQPRASGGTGASREEVIERKCVEISERIPGLFDVAAVMEAYPVSYSESMNTVITQECIRYNGLLGVMALSLRETVKALKGLVVMSGELEQVANAIFDNQVPAAWEKVAYPSLKPLSSWIVDLLERLSFIQKWIDEGPPPVYWISGVFFPQAFLTGTLQNYARKYSYAIDTVSFDFKVMDHVSVDEQKGPEDGCYIRGLFVEGARWNPDKHALDESRPKELFTDMPVCWLVPAKDRVVPTSGIYDCPVYKTLARKGELSTTGHSTNFVIFMEIPSDKDQQWWACRGVALFCALGF